MANKFEDIRKAVTGPFSGLLSGVDVVYPNQQDYSPSINKPHVRLFVFNNQPSAFTLGRDGQDVHTGVLQASLFYPREQTDAPLLRAADIIETTYQQYIRGGYLSSGDVNVRITSVGLGSPSQDGAWYFAPVNINFESYIKGIL